MPHPSFDHTYQAVVHSLVGATAAGATVDIRGLSSLGIYVSGLTTGTLAPQVSNDSATWSSIPVTNVASNASGTIVTASGNYRADISGFQYLKMPITDFTTGTITVGINGQPNAGGASSGGGISSGTINSATVVGNVASGAADSGNPVKVGGKYNASAPTLTDGFRGDLQLDVNGLAKVREGYAPGYEDNTNLVAGMLQKPVSSSTYAPSEYTNFGAVPGTNVKSSAGNIFAVHVTSIATAITYFQLFNASSAVPNGATPVASYAMGSVTAGGVAELKLDTGHFAPSRYNSTGISWAISSTNGTLGTASITAANHNVHIKYV